MSFYLSHFTVPTQTNANHVGPQTNHQATELCFYLSIFVYLYGGNKLNHFLSDAEDLPRYRPPMPTVTTSGSSDVTQHQSFSHALPGQRLPVGPGQLGGKTLTVKAVCRPDIHAQKGGAGDKPQTLL